MVAAISPSRMKTTKLIVATIVVTLALMFGSLERAAGQAASSLTEQEIEASETRTALGALVRENAELRKKLEQAESTVAALQKNLAVTSGEAEVLKRKVSELMLRFEALGFDAAGDSDRVGQRLLKAVSDLRLSDEDREALRKALIELSEAVLQYQAAAPTTNTEARAALEVAMRNASKALGGFAAEVAEGAPVAASLTEALVIAIKEDYALVVTNVGRNHGVKVGMPFRVIRGDNELGIVRVVDVREKVAGAVIQDLRSDQDKIQVGDRLKVGAER
jgi:chromosome segregation ATPase